jgi:hypothetical protein
MLTMRRWMPALLVTGSLACVPDEEKCFLQSEDLSPDDSVRGYVLRDLLDGYFGRHEGTLRWQDASTTSFSLDLRYAEGGACTVYEVYDCRPRKVTCPANASIVTGEGLFDHETSATVTTIFPWASPGLAPESVANFGARPDSYWNEGLAARLPLDLSRYGSVALELRLVWPPSELAPTGGRLEFYGTLARAPELLDTVQVATLEF